MEKGGHVKEVETTFKNPLYIKNRKHEKQVIRDFKKSHNVQMVDKSGKYPRPSKEFSDAFRKYLIDKGHDGYISSIPKRPKYGKMRQYVALNPDQAKITGKLPERETIKVSEECYNSIMSIIEDNYENAKIGTLGKGGQKINKEQRKKSYQAFMADKEDNVNKVFKYQDNAQESPYVPKIIRNLHKSSASTNYIGMLNKNPNTITKADANSFLGNKHNLVENSEEISELFNVVENHLKKIFHKEEKPQELTPKQQKRKIEVPKITVQGVFGEAIELAEAIITEIWKGDTGITDFENPDNLKYRKRANKRVFMSPDDYIKKATGTFKRQGYKTKASDIEKQRSSDRETIEYLKNIIKDPNTKVDEPYIQYKQTHGNRDGEQEGIHRAIAAKELGYEKIPVHLIHPTNKRTPQEKRNYQQSKKNKKDA